MLHIKIKIGEPLQSQAPEVRSDVPQQRPAAAPGLTKFLMTTACLWFYCGAAPRQRAESRGKDGESRSVTSLRRAVTAVCREHIYQARSLEVFIPAAAAVPHT